MSGQHLQRRPEARKTGVRLAEVAEANFSRFIQNRGDTPIPYSIPTPIQLKWSLSWDPCENTAPDLHEETSIRYLPIPTSTSL